MILLKIVGKSRGWRRGVPRLSSGRRGGRKVAEPAK